MAIKPQLASKLKSPLSLLLLATALAAGVAAVAYMYLQQREESMKNELAAKSRKNAAPMVSVVVPKLDVGVNTPLSTVNFVSRPIEADLVYPDTLLAKDFESMGGLKLARPVLRGRPVRASDLQAPVVNDVASILPSGSRAMTIEIDNVNSIAQTLRPHNHVDIFLMSKAPQPALGSQPVDEKSLEQATLFMQDMVVLATGKEFQDVSNNNGPDPSKMTRPGEVEGARDNTYDTITLLVKPAEAAKLMVGHKMGTYRVVLRGTNDRDALAMKPLRAGDLMAGGRARDTGIEFIVGGRGDNPIGRLAIPPSQQPQSSAPQLAQYAQAQAPAQPSAQPSVQPAAQPPIVRGAK